MAAASIASLVIAAWVIIFIAKDFLATALLCWKREFGQEYKRAEDRSQKTE